MRTTTKACANPKCGRRFQTAAKGIEYCCRQCWRDTHPDAKPGGPGAPTWPTNRFHRGGAMYIQKPGTAPPRDPVAQAALIARVAAEMGVPVSSNAGKPRTKETDRAWTERMKVNREYRRKVDPRTW